MPKPKQTYTGGLDAPKPTQPDYNADSVYGLPINESSLSLVGCEEIRIGAFVWNPTGLSIDGLITREDWEQTGKLLQKLEGSLQWLIGDLIVCGEQLEWGDQKQIAEDFGFEYSTIRNFAYVSRNVELSIRSDKLSFGHHQLVAPLSQDDQICFLTSAAEGEHGKIWSIARLRKEIDDYLKRQPEEEPLPKFLYPLRALRNAYNPKQWKAMTKGERHRVYTELKGYLAYIGEEFEGEE